MYYRTCPPRAVRDDLTAAGFAVTTLPLTALGRREDGSPRYRLVLARRPGTPSLAGQARPRAQGRHVLTPGSVDLHPGQPPTRTHRAARLRGTPALRMRRREMLRKGQVAASLVAQRAAHGARGPAHRRIQPGPGVGVELAGLRLGGQPQRPSPGQFGQETLVLAVALLAPAASHPGQHRAVRRQRERQVPP